MKCFEPHAHTVHNQSFPATTNATFSGSALDADFECVVLIPRIPFFGVNRSFDEGDFH